MSKNPFISVIIPVLNGAGTLGLCLNSLIRQNFSDFEILVMDGKSGDGSVKLAHDILDSSGVSFDVSSRQDGSVYEAMDQGVVQSRGEWLYFLGADDQVYSENSFEELLPALLDHNIDMVFAGVTVDGTACKAPPAVVQGRLLKTNVCHQGILYRRKLFDLYGDYNPRYRVYADWDLNMRFLIAGASYKTINVTVARYATTGLSAREGDQLFYNEVELNEARYRFRFAAGRGKTKWLFKICLRYAQIQRKNLMFLLHRASRRKKSVQGDTA